MRQLSLSFLLVAIAAMPAAAQDDKQPKTLMEKVSYSIGLRMGANFSGDDIEIDLSWLTKGISDGMQDKSEPLLSEAQQREAMIEFQKDLQKKQIAKAAAAGKKNKEDGEKFLATNKGKDGVQTTASGLQYQVLEEGDGAKPKATDTVKVHYHGTLIDGTVFDSSVDRGEPAQFPVNRVIKGWTEALQLMQVGDKYRLVIPSDLAYGESGAGGDIGPNAVLVFEVELLDIVE